jgi:hypothetical protein
LIPGRAHESDVAVRARGPDDRGFARDAARDERERDDERERAGESARHRRTGAVERADDAPVRVTTSTSATR